MSEQKKEAVVEVAADVRAMCMKHAKDVNEQWLGNFGQDKCSIAHRRALLEVLDGEQIPEPDENPDLHAKVLQVGKVFANANAVNNTLKGRDGKKEDIVQDLRTLA